MEKGQMCCGCRIVLGREVDVDMLKEHHKHTLETMFFWEILMRTDADPLAKMELSQARVDYTNALEKLYPEALDNLR